MEHLAQFYYLTTRDAIDDGLPNPRGESLSRLAIIFICISGMFVLLRLLTRYIYGHQIGLDDMFIFGSLVLTIAMTVTYHGEAQNGFGLHRTQVSRPHKVKAFKWFFATQLLYKIATCFTKMSLCTMYLRIFPSKRFRCAVFIVVAVTVVYTLIAVLLTVFSCHPIPKAWDKALDGKCLESRKIWYATSILIILTDVMIIFLPVNEIRRLRLPLVKKLLLVGLFSLGIFVIACTIIRMITVSPETTAEDQIYYQATSNSWTFVETNVGIVCACLPILRLPLSRQLRKILGLSAKKTQRKRPEHNSLFSFSTAARPRSPRESPRTSIAEESVENLAHEKPHGICVSCDVSMQATDQSQSSHGDSRPQRCPV